MSRFAFFCSFFFSVSASIWYFEAFPIKITIHCCVGQYHCAKQCSLYYQEKICDSRHFSLGIGCELNGSLYYMPSNGNEDSNGHSGYKMGEFRIDRRRKVIGSEGIIWRGDAKNWKITLDDRNVR